VVNGPRPSLLDVQGHLGLEALAVESSEERLEANPFILTLKQHIGYAATETPLVQLVRCSSRIQFAVDNRLAGPTFHLPFQRTPPFMP
jgi:hypothetical protein